METVYEKYKTASEYLMEYYTWVDILGIEKREFEEHAEAMEKHCKRLYENFEVGPLPLFLKDSFFSKCSSSM